MIDLAYGLYMAETEGDYDLRTGEKFVDADLFHDMCYYVTKAILEDDVYNYKEHPAWKQMTKDEKKRFMSQIMYVCAFDEDKLTWNFVMDNISDARGWCY